MCPQRLFDEAVAKLTPLCAQDAETVALPIYRYQLDHVRANLPSILPTHTPCVCGAGGRSARDGCMLGWRAHGLVCWSVSATTTGPWICYGGFWGSTCIACTAEGGGGTGMLLVRLLVMGTLVQSPRICYCFYEISPGRRT